MEVPWLSLQGGNSSVFWMLCPPSTSNLTLLLWCSGLLLHQAVPISLSPLRPLFRAWHIAGPQRDICWNTLVMPTTCLLRLLSCLLFPGSQVLGVGFVLTPAGPPCTFPPFYFTFHLIPHILVIYLAALTNHSKILWLKTAAALCFVCLWLSSGLGSSGQFWSCWWSLMWLHSVGKLAGTLHSLGLQLVLELLRFHVDSEHGLSMCSLQQGCQRFYVAA